MFSISLLTTLLVIHHTHARPGEKGLPSGELDYPSNEDSTYQPPSDDSISAWKDEENWSEQESDAQSAESSTDAAYDEIANVNSDELFSTEKQPTKQKKKGAPVLQQVCDKADRFSRNLEKAVGLADKKMTDWTRRIAQFRFHIFGPMRQGGGMNGYGNGGGGNYWNGGGGQFGMNGNMGNNGISLMGAYRTIWPFIKELGTALNKVLMYGSKLAAELFVAVPAPSRRRARPAGPARSSRYRKRKSPNYRYRGKGRARGGAGAARKTRATTVFTREPDYALPAYEDRDDMNEYN